MRLKLILNGMCLDWIHLSELEPVVGSFEHTNEPSIFIKCRKFLHKPSNY
jgi:hypothetical protein